MIDPALVAVLRDAGFDAEAVTPDAAIAAAAGGDVRGAVLAARSPFDIDIIRSLRRAARDCRILALLDGADFRDIVIDALVAGADGFAFARRPSDIVKPLRLLLAGETVIPRALTELLADALAMRAGGLERAHRRLNLTPSESSVCRWLARGMSPREIGEQLGISPTTARRHIASAMHKCGVGSREELLALLAGSEPTREAA